MLLTVVFGSLILATAALDTGAPVFVPGRENVGPNAQSVAVSPDGRFVAAGFGGEHRAGAEIGTFTPGRVRVWEVTTGKVVLDREEFGDVIKLGFTADSTALIYARIYTPGDSVRDYTVKGLELATGKVLASWDADTFAVSAANSVLAIGHN